jgi:signal transduction histidine kinase
MSHSAKPWVLAVTGLVLAQAVASLTVPAGFPLTAFSDLAQCLLLVSAGLAFLPNSKGGQQRNRGFWFLMTLGIALWLAYDLIWTFVEVYLRRDVPDPFSADAVLFFHLVPMIAALALQPHSDYDERDARLGSIDFALLFIWWVYLYLFAVVPWQYAFPDVAGYDASFNFLYLTEKLAFLVGLVLLWSRSSGAWNKIYSHLFGASTLYALSSFLANWAISRHVYFSGSLYDIPLEASIAWLTAIGLMAREVDLQPKPAKAHSEGLWVARLGMITTLSLPALATWIVLGSSAPAKVSKFRLLVTLIAMLLMGCVMLFRQYLLNRKMRGLLLVSEMTLRELKDTQAQLVESEKLASLGQLVGGAAHELNNPLAAMLGYADMLSITSLNQQDRARVEKIGQHVRHAKVLVSSLLSFAKQTPVEKTLLDLNTLVQTSARLCGPQFSTRGIRITIATLEHLPRVMGDSNQLLQVCLHIMSNALLVSPSAGGELEITTSGDDNRVFVEFSGDALNTEDMLSPGSSATSLGQPPAAPSGLSACYGIVQEHKGKILFQSSPGKVTFRIELPAAPESNPIKESQQNSMGRMQRRPASRTPS